MNEDNIYTIRRGDTFWSLEKEWNIPHGTLQKLNPKLDPQRLQIGHKIKMPNLLYLVVIKKRTDHLNISPYIPKAMPIDNLYVHQSSVVPSNKGFNFVEYTVGGVNNVLGGMGVVNAYLRSAHLSNEVWHLQKNGTIVHRWKNMTNGASYWKNNLVAKNRKIFQTLAKAEEIAPKFLKRAGFVAVGGDVILSGELKPSQAIATGLLIGSSTGVGAIVAGVYFVVDIGFGILTEHSLSERIDNSIGTIEMYEGLY